MSTLRAHFEHTNAERPSPDFSGEGRIAFTHWKLLVVRPTGIEPATSSSGG